MDWMSRREAPWYRSMLFVPGHKLDWMLKAPKYGADALLFDLEDAVPVEDKADARSKVAHALRELSDGPFGRFVRINPWGSGNLLADLIEIVGPGLDGVALPKTTGADDISGLDRVLTELEVTRGLPVGRIEIQPDAETANAMYRLYDVCMASLRVRRAAIVGHAVPDADITRALGVDINETGDEMLAIGSYQVLQARAAGVRQIGGGMTTKIDDLDLVRRIATRAKRMGATGAEAIHPSHIPILNEVYSPDAASVERAKETIKAMANAIERGDAAVRHEGAMVDYAHVRTALDLVRRAEAVGMDVGDIPNIDLHSYE